LEDTKKTSHLGTKVKSQGELIACIGSINITMEAQSESVNHRNECHGMVKHLSKCDRHVSIKKKEKEKKIWFSFFHLTKKKIKNGNNTPLMIPRLAFNYWR
jgi:hypothetical protein